MITRPRTSKKSSSVSGLFVLIGALFSSLFVGFVSWLDAICFLEIWYGLRFLAVAVYLISPILVFMRSSAIRVITACSVIWMLLVLPSVRWNREKSFYVDARRIEFGMTAAQAREIMADYLELGANFLPTLEEQEWLPLPPDPRYKIIFLHSAIGWSDHCAVMFDAQGKVRTIRIEKD